jgi:hypothetical protein
VVARQRDRRALERLEVGVDVRQNRDTHPGIMANARVAGSRRPSTARSRHGISYSSLDATGQNEEFADTSEHIER